MPSSKLSMFSVTSFTRVFSLERIHLSTGCSSSAFAEGRLFFASLAYANEVTVVDEASGQKEQAGIPAAFINSSLTAEQYRAVFRRARAGPHRKRGWAGRSPW